MKKWKNRIKVVCFVICFVCLFQAIQKRFLMEDKRIYQTMAGFYDEPENSLDVVYVGSSNVYAYYQAPLAWNDFGYTSFSLSIPGLPMHATKYMIEEARKTQPDALYVINMNNFRRDDFNANYLHFSTNWMKFSMNKVKMITEMSKVCGVEHWTGLLEIYFPLIRFHSAWNELETASFDFTKNNLRGASVYNPYLKTVTDVSKNHHTTETRVEPDEVQMEVLTDLLDYLEENSVKALFVSVPQAIKSEEVLGQWNSIGDIIEERGFDYLNLFGEAEEIGMQFETDFYNNLHANVHGALKYTYYFGQYLTETYGLTDKRNDSRYADWNTSYELYIDIISEYALDFELRHGERDYDLAVPELKKAREADGNITLTWEAAENAEKYLIYRKEKHTVTEEIKPWTCIGEVSKDTLSYEDSGLTSAVKYTYTVVPVREEAGGMVYGSFDMAGISNTIE